ncbi:hypothetical protein F8388_021775 [Cannabis sativa]|uniref:Uncharacterized protein n=1 Tax=Cannabis sativa TaxID=3483 RepID=A0A7J6DSZ6_CANSA|nr:hypothetical protein G4B88_000535 [Cannabis sativa]KAF4349207.1 hypothetical protein F8388_021775 [Cannabis sativa]
MLPLGSNSRPTTPLLAVLVCQATLPSTLARTRFPSTPNVSVAFSPTGLSRLASQTNRRLDVDRRVPIRIARV